jgi:hypothetical protein
MIRYPCEILSLLYGYVGITIREAADNIPAQALNRHCSRCPYHCVVGDEKNARRSSIKQ